nr:glycosyl transferase family 2 [Actinomycetota bacterium]
CMMVRTEVFRQLGGFDEDFSVCFNDVDFCLRLRQAGYLVVYTPFAELVHHESSARGMAVDEREAAELVRRWGPVTCRDPYFNPNLDVRRAECALPR